MYDKLILLPAKQPKIVVESARDVTCIYAGLARTPRYAPVEGARSPSTPDPLQIERPGKSESLN